MSIKAALSTATLILLWTCFIAAAQLDQLLKKVEPGSQPANLAGMSLNQDKIAGGLKEALTKSTGSRVASTGLMDGYFKDW